MKKNILICDDAAFMRKLLTKILVEDGYEIMAEADNGRSAVELYLELKPDLVLMDITMPLMDGLEATKEIIKEDPDARIVVCSSMGQQTLVMESIQAGAKDFIVKPFQPKRVIMAVRNVIGVSC